MNKIIILLFFISTKAIAQVEGVWSGTVSMEVHSTSVTGTKHAVFHTTIQDNYVTGSMEGMDSAIIEGKFYAAHKSQGAGKGELVKVWFYEDGTYEIHVESCQFSEQNDDGGWGDPSTLPLATYNQPIKSRDLLSGTRTETTDLGGLGTQTTTVSWHLSRTYGPSLIVIPDMYNDWMPEPGKDELTAGNTMKLTLKLLDAKGQPMTSEQVSFELKLVNTSREPGITINYPAQPMIDLPDLRFLPQGNVTIEDEFQTLKFSCNNCGTATATITSFDGGGYATLNVFATIEGGTKLSGNLLVKGGTTDISIPKRDPGKHIAKKWADQFHNPNDDDDKDQSTGNQKEGDGLSVYEEYRGVFSKGVFKRLDPEKKELGVWVERKKYSLFSTGFASLENAAFIKVIPLLDDEMAADRIFNRNHQSNNVYEQYVEKIDTGWVSGDAVGENQPVDLTTKLPKQSERIVIDVTKIANSYKTQARALAKAHMAMPYTLSESIANTVAHELAHGIGLDHHGPPSDEPAFEVPKKSVDVYHVYDAFNNEIMDRPCPIEGLIGLPHNDESGDLNCIMAYTNLYQWVKRVTLSSIDYYAIKPLSVGKKLCTGTGGNGTINSNDKYFSDAKDGNCLSKIKFR